MFNNNQEILTIQCLGVRYGDTQALNDISLSMQQGEIIGIVGESGSGKSTLLKAIAGLLSPSAAINSESILYHGIDITEFSHKKMRMLRGSKIGFLFQNAENSLDPLFTIEKQFNEALKAHKRKSKNKSENHAIQIEALHHVGLYDTDRILKSIPSELSGGMCQRVALAITLALGPDILLADEPTSALDESSQKKVVEILQTLNEKENLSILIVSHDINLVGSLAHKIAVVHNGKIVEFGPSTQIINNPKHPYTQSLIGAILPKKDNIKVEKLGANHAS